MRNNSLYLSLGSNIEPRLKYIKNAVVLLNEVFTFVKASFIYETKALEFTEQNDFYNICILYKTEIDDPFIILNIIKDIEKKTGRHYNCVLKGPREIDIDIVFFDEKNIVSDKLKIPHEKMHERRFVLVPLLEILSKDDDFFKKYDFNKFLNDTTDQKIIKIGEL